MHVCKCMIILNNENLIISPVARALFYHDIVLAGQSIIKYKVKVADRYCIKGGGAR